MPGTNAKMRDTSGKGDAPPRAANQIGHGFDGIWACGCAAGGERKEGSRCPGHGAGSVAREVFIFFGMRGELCLRTLGCLAEEGFEM